MRNNTYMYYLISQTYIANNSAQIYTLINIHVHVSEAWVPAEIFVGGAG